MKTTKPFLLLIALLLSLCLGACQGESAPDQGNTKDLESLDPQGALVVYWYPWTGATEALQLDMIADFNDDNPWGITVVGEYQGSDEKIYQKIRAGIPSQVPHLAVAYPGQIATYARLDGVVDLTPYIQSPRWGFEQAERDDFFSDAFRIDQFPQFGNKQYGFSPYRSARVLYYNQDWLQELGHDDPPQTWETFRQMACAASNPAEEKFGLEISLDATVFMDMLTSRGGTLTNEDASAYAFGGREGQATLQFLQGLTGDGCAILQANQFGAREDFGVGQVLFSLGSTAELPAYRQAVAAGANFNWNVAPFPHTPPEPVITVHGPSLTLFQTEAREQLAAWLFLKWLTEPEQQARWARNTHHFPIRRSAASEMSDYLQNNPQYQQAFGLLEHTWRSEPGLAAHEACRNELYNMLNAVTAGEDAATWLENSLQACNDILAESRPE